MSRGRRLSPARRRDGGVRVIRSGDFTYPGTNPQPGQDTDSGAAASASGPRSGRRGLAPARDAGLALGGGVSREERKRAARNRSRAIGLTVAVVALGALALGWQYSSERLAARMPLPAGANVSASATQTASAATVVRATNPARTATPYFASYKKLKLRLPVSVEDLTEVGFHQASYGYALHLRTHLPEAKNAAVKKDRSTHRDISAQSTAPDAKLVGEALVMWRSRPGKPDTAADVGADPGSDVIAPVSGTVIKVKKFKLYGQFPDYEIHIQPRGYPTIDCVLIHVSDVSCKPGDQVVAGVSRIAAIRKLDRRVGPQLKSYTKNGGHHTHIQLNDTTDPKYEGLKGAIVPTEAAPVRATP